MSLVIERWIPPDQGALFVVTGASGTGKTTLVQAALQTVPGIDFSVSATTRPARSDERAGVDYHFLAPAEFDEKVGAGEFLEWAEVYGHRYGTLRASVTDAISSGRSILLDIDTQGAAQVRVAMPEAVTIFILPPSIETLGERLRARATDSPESITRRIREAQLQLGQCSRFDYIVVNDHLESAQDQFAAVLVAELRKTTRSATLIARFSVESVTTN